jgi:asparagine synthase (glutamine-hydrolysing)
MCGLVGILAAPATERAAALEVQVRRMARAVRHRGPDGEGVLVESGRGCVLALGHRRLAIIDPSEQAAQPMTDASGRYTLIFNGAVYNFVEILAQLGDRAPAGCRSDTAALLYAWKAWGPGCLSRLNGMFAFALWDRAEQALYLARDRFGKKPLLYARAPAPGLHLLFGSEAKALFAAGTLAARPELRGLAQFLATRDVDHEPARTLFEQVEQVPAGCYVRAAIAPGDTIDLRCERYYHLRPPPRRPLDDDLVAEVRALLDDAVRLRLRSDVPVGGSLSGGLDSSVVTALAVARAPSYRVFVSSFAPSSDAPLPGPLEAGDETGWAEQVLSGLHIPPAAVVRSSPTAGEFARDLLTVLYHQEAPFADTSICAHFALLRRVSEAGVKVLLSGQGGDEVMGGYPSYFFVLLGELVRARRLRALWHEAQARRSLVGEPPRRLLLGALYQAAPPWLRQPLYALRVRAQFPLSPEGERLWRAAPARFLSEPPPLCQGPPEAWTVFDRYLLDCIARYALPHILRHDDRSSMAHGVESRAPFLDHRLLELMLATDPAARLGDGYTKRLLRQAARGLLPEAVRLRVDKTGFFSPLLGWLLADEARVRAELQVLPPELAALARPSEVAAAVEALYRGQVRSAAATVWTALVATLWLRYTLPALGTVD